jgi:hypothetical protein
MGSSDQPAPALPLPNSVGGGRPTCACGCARTPQRGKPYAWLCDPDIPAELKVAARGRGMKRRALDVERVEFRTVEGRQALRETIAALVLRDELAPSLAQVALKALDGAAQDEERNRPRLEEARELNVIVEKFAREPAG